MCYYVHIREQPHGPNSTDRLHEPAGHAWAQEGVCASREAGSSDFAGLGSGCIGTGRKRGGLRTPTEKRAQRSKGVALQADFQGRRLEEQEE